MYHTATSTHPNMLSSPTTRTSREDSLGTACEERESITRAAASLLTKPPSSPPPPHPTMHVHTSNKTHTYTHRDTRMYVPTSLYMYVYIHIYMYLCIGTHTHKIKVKTSSYLHSQCCVCPCVCVWSFWQQTQTLSQLAPCLFTALITHTPAHTDAGVCTCIHAQWHSVVVYNTCTVCGQVQLHYIFLFFFTKTF